MNAKQNKTIAAIARQYLGLLTLKERKHDALDFHELAVWNIQKALIAAYEAGQAQLPDTTMGDAIREHISPQAVAAIVAWLQPAHTNNPNVNREVRWFADQLAEMLGPELNPLTEELGL
jgi:hypothetical protein